MFRAAMGGEEGTCEVCATDPALRRSMREWAKDSSVGATPAPDWLPSELSGGGGASEWRKTLEAMLKICATRRV